ncbi:hypothetical protein ISG33_14475 [Glaciecola sp. MH2013]|uniref:hypothetical protein n=1 Tax=Glaciecola sp. MH2013 TaxID=2785524 RepID=UPI00189E3FD2|nr:hypothetical protein [Glaciecola sp. MH2013]MBF7074608.1 hypothetical protein [Glaciecola sp. MH2013]
MLLKELKSLKLSKELVSIDRDCHDEEMTGFLLEVNENFMVMSLYTDDGLFDGVSMFETSQIDEVYWGNREHESIKALISDSAVKMLGKLKSTTFENAILEVGNENNSLCIYCHHNESKFEVAEIINQSDGWLKIHTFGAKRSLSRLYKLIQVDSISRVDFNSPYQNNIVKLHGSDL